MIYEMKQNAILNIVYKKCVKEIKACLSDNFLLPNESKTEPITVIPVNQSAVAKFSQLGVVTIPLSAFVTNLGAVFDRKCKMAEHSTRICRKAKDQRLSELQQRQFTSAFISYVTSGLHKRLVA